MTTSHIIRRIAAVLACCIGCVFAALFAACATALYLVIIQGWFITIETGTLPYFIGTVLALSVIYLLIFAKELLQRSTLAMLTICSSVMSGALIYFHNTLIIPTPEPLLIILTLFALLNTVTWVSMYAALIKHDYARTHEMKIPALPSPTHKRISLRLGGRL